MRVFGSILVVCLCAFTAFAQDFILVGGSVIDGSGKPRASANVRVRDGRIAELGSLKPESGETVIDVKGMIVAPGFVDLKSLSPASVQKDPAVGESLLLQGVTTAILGADGSGPYLVEEFMLPFDEKPAALNLVLLVGHGIVRKQIMGDDFKRPANAREIQLMSELVDEAMKEGAFGFASDLTQDPASFGTPEELLALARAVARLGGSAILTLRNETDKLSASVREAVNIAREAKVPVQVLTTSKAAIGQIDAARTQRVDIAADSYSFAQFTREKTVTVERAVQRLSATPASRLSLRDRGVLKKGGPADIVVFNPQALPEGMKFVFVNGVIAVKDGQPTGDRAGQAVR
jgi:N-acyl-D-amino-acid deacylase